MGQLEEGARSDAEKQPECTRNVWVKGASLLRVSKLQFIGMLARSLPHVCLHIPAQGEGARVPKILEEPGYGAF